MHRPGVTACLGRAVGGAPETTPSDAPRPVMVAFCGRREFADVILGREMALGSPGGLEVVTGSS